MGKRMMTWQEVMDELSMSKSTIEEEIRQGRFPKPRRVSAQLVRFLPEEIEAWRNSRPESDIPPPKNCGAGKRGNAAAD